MKTSNDSACCDTVKPGNEIRMGREVPAYKKAASGDSEKDAKRAAKDKQDKIEMDKASSLV